jgi:DNA-binding HxlR family transcriptional regulator
MKTTEGLYVGCPVQHARQFIAGKWQMGILWNLKDQARSFSEFKALLPGISDKILTQELDFFVGKKVIEHHDVSYSSKTVYSLSPVGRSLIPVLTTIVEWGYCNLQDEQVNKEMAMTPMPAIQAIEENLGERE